MNKKFIMVPSHNKDKITKIVRSDDEFIDYSDIPATDENFWQGAVIHNPEKAKPAEKSR